jgi:hypothetical protein
MAITPGSAGAWAYAASGSVTTTLPAHATGDMLLVRVAFKSSAVATCVASTATSGWAKHGQYTGATNSGNGTGSVNLAVFWKVATSSSETNPTITFATAVTQVGHVAVSYQKGSSETWDALFSGSSGTGAAFTATTGVSVGPGSSWTGGYATGDMFDLWLATADDTTITAITLTRATVTFDTVVEYPATAGIDTSGADGAYDGAYRLVTAGGVTTNVPQVTATLSTSENGTVWVTRLRVTAAGNITVTPTTAALIVTRNIPTVTASNHQSVTPTTAALTSATFAPQARTPILSTPAAASLTVTRHTPTVVTGGAYVAAVLADSPVGYWRMGEASGSVLDSIGSSHGTATGTTRDVTGALTTAQDDGAITFNGTSDKVRMGDVLDQTGAVSYELWVKRANTTGALQYLMNKGAGQPNIVLKADHYITVGEENVDLVLSSTAILNDTNWHHIVFTWTGAAAVDAAKLYVDGVNVGVHQNTATIAGNGSSLSLGAAYVDALYFAGTIDEAAIYNTVLSPTRVLAHYNAGITAGGLVLTTYAPTIRQGIGVIPTTKALALATFAPTVTASNHQSVTPTTAVLTITENVPTVTASNHQSVTPTTSSLALTAFAPVVTATDQQTVTPTTAALLLSAFAPSVTATADQTVIPTSATVVLTGNAPTVTAEADVTVIPGTASVTTTTYAPTVSAAQHVSVIPGTAVLTVTELVPTATVSDHQRVTPATAVLTITEQVPAAQTPSRVVPATAPLAITKYAPTVTTPQTLTAGLKTLTTATFAPTITNPQTYVPAKATLTLSAFAPTVDVTAASTIVIPKATLTATRYAPTVTANQHVMVTPNAATLVTSPQVPTVAASDHQRVTPSTKAVVLTSSAPMVDVSDQQAIVPGRATLAITAYAPTVSASADIAVIPGTKVLQLLGYAPTARVANRATPATTTLVLTTLAPIVTPTLNTLVRPNHNVLTITEYGPVLEISGHAAFTPITAGLLLTTYPPTAETHSITPLPRPIYGFAIVATGPGASVGTAAGGATVRSVEGGSTAVSTSGPSARVRIR